MSVSKLSSRLAMPTRAVQRVNIRSPCASSAPQMRYHASGSGSEPPRSQGKPAQPGEMKGWLPIAGVGAGLGAVFFYMMSQPNNVPKAAHATGQNLQELTGRDTVDEKSGRRMGTQRST